MQRQLKELVVKDQKYSEQYDVVYILPEGQMFGRLKNTVGLFS
jgi:hypothetical protein